jgi:iron complex transport system ATP-binding protein
MTSPSFQAGRILEIEKAAVYRGDTCVFEAFFTLEEGAHRHPWPERAGKSTLLKLLAGEVHPVPNDATRIRLFGEEQWNVGRPQGLGWCPMIFNISIWIK